MRRPPSDTLPTLPRSWRRSALGLAAAALLLGFAAGGVSAADSLVPNGSFTVVAPCPSGLDNGIGSIERAAPWERAGQSPDLFHSCSTEVSSDVPHNALGHQMPVDDLPAQTVTVFGGYAGLSVWHSACDACREYMQVPLTQSLSAGARYRVSFQVSRAETAPYAIDRLGAHLSDGPLPLAGGVMPVLPQVEHDGPAIEEHLGWELITGTFVADGGEDHLTIGNFYEDIDVDAVAVDGMTGMAYYYVDAVAVEEADINDLEDLTTRPASDGSMRMTLVGATPGSRAVLYGARSLATRHIGGHTFDLGPEVFVLAEATVSQAGRARFTWPWKASTFLADPRTGVLHLEAATHDREQGLVDSSQLSARITADTAVVLATQP